MEGEMSDAQLVLASLVAAAVLVAVGMWRIKILIERQRGALDLLEWDARYWD